MYQDVFSSLQHANVIIKHALSHLSDFERLGKVRMHYAPPVAFPVVLLRSVLLLVSVHGGVRVVLWYRHTAAPELDGASRCSAVYNYFH